MIVNSWKVIMLLLGGILIGITVGGGHFKEVMETLPYVGDILGLVFTLVGTVVGVSVVIKAHEATLEKIKGDERVELMRVEATIRRAKSEERVEQIKMSIALSKIRASIYKRLEELQVKLSSDINNLREEIKRGKIKGMFNPRSNEVHRLKPLIRVYFSDETYKKYLELVDLIFICDKKNSPDILRHTGKHDEALQAYGAMERCFLILFEEYIVSDMKINTIQEIIQ